MKTAINEVVVVEGKYDKIKLDSVIDADIITLDGFGIFKSEEKKALIRHAAKTRGVIVLTDSDSAGLVIRNHITNITGGAGVVNLYVPSVKGKEKRKEKPSKEGLLGVEGIDADTIRTLFEAYKTNKRRTADITGADLYENGLSGSDGASEKRKKLARLLNLPENMGKNAFLSALNLMLTKEEFLKICEDLK